MLSRTFIRYPQTSTEKWPIFFPCRYCATYRQWGAFRFGHTHPGFSNIGLLSIIAFVHGVAGKNTPLKTEIVHHAEVSQAIVDQFLATNDFIQRLHPDDVAGVLAFNSTIEMIADLERAGDTVGYAAERISAMTAMDGTALYDALCQATELMIARQAENVADEGNRLYGIVLLSDGGDSNSSASESHMFSHCLPAHAEADGIKVFPIAFGEDANEEVLARMAEMTGGRSFSADPDSIDAIYLRISAEQ